MMPNPSMAAAVLALALLGSLPRPAKAQSDEPADQGMRLLEVGAGHHNLSSGYAAWQEASVRGLYRQGSHLWGMELMHADRFGERGTFVGLQDRVHLAPRWDMSLAYGVGDGAPWLPRDRVDGFVHHTWGEHLNWVTNVGMGYYKAPDEHRDRWGSIGLTAWLEPHLKGPWIAQGEVRWSQSNPGSVNTRQYFVALTWGRHGQTQITGRHGWGREGWQSLGDARSIVDFASRQDTLIVQHWMAPDWGIKVVADHYRNDQYRRSGVNVAWFKEWR